MVVAETHGYGVPWSTRPDLICRSADGTHIEMIEITQAAVLRNTQLPTALNQLAGRVCLPPRLHALRIRVIYAHAPSDRAQDRSGRDGFWEADTTLGDPEVVIQGMANWLLDIMQGGGIAACPFALTACTESLYWTPPGLVASAGELSAWP